MVSTDARLATRVGAQILAAGGSACDAAIGTAFALAVVFPAAGNIAGGGFMVYRPAGGAPVALDFRETAPAAAHRDMYLDPKTSVLTNRSETGALAAGVPGSVAGLWAIHKRCGTRPWRALIDPAIQLARDGFEVDEALSTSLRDEQARIAAFETTAALFYPNGRPLAKGTMFYNPDLARVLHRIADNGPRGFYEGPTAALIVDEMQRSGGIITAEDLRSYAPKWREPVVFSYRGHQVITMPPPSSGGLVLALMARVLSPVNVGALGWQSAAHVHRIAETLRHAFARRNRYLGDPDFTTVPTDRFDSEQAAQEVRDAFDPQRATPSETIRTAANGLSGRHTTNISIVDGAGNAVALTTTINMSYGAGLVVRGGGFLLNDEMDDFAAAPGQPNAYDLVQGEENAIVPGKRPLSSMTPTIVVDADGRVRLVTGAAGGPRIITAVFQVLSNVLDFGFGIQRSVSHPRIHHQHLPDILLHDPSGLSAETRAQLMKMGYRLDVPTPDFGLGDAPSIGREPNGWCGGVETRQSGASAMGPNTIR